MSVPPHCLVARAPSKADPRPSLAAPIRRVLGSWMLPVKVGCVPLCEFMNVEPIGEPLHTALILSRELAFHSALA